MGVAEVHDLGYIPREATEFGVRRQGLEPRTRRLRNTFAMFVEVRLRSPARAGGPPSSVAVRRCPLTLLSTVAVTPGAGSPTVDNVSPGPRQLNPCVKMLLGRAGKSSWSRRSPIGSSI